MKVTIEEGERYSFLERATRMKFTVNPTLIKEQKHTSLKKYSINSLFEDISQYKNRNFFFTLLGFIYDKVHQGNDRPDEWLLVNPNDGCFFAENKDIKRSLSHERIFMELLGKQCLY